MEACPWGLNGYGFDPYIAATPGNVVMALASFWADNGRATLMAEERFGDKAFRLRYEDLIADPEATAAGLFEFLGVSQVPGISERCFSSERERFGPADYAPPADLRVPTATPTAGNGEGGAGRAGPPADSIAVETLGAPAQEPLASGAGTAGTPQRRRRAESSVKPRSRNL